MLAYMYLYTRNNKKGIHAMKFYFDNFLDFIMKIPRCRAFHSFW